MPKPWPTPQSLQEYTWRRGHCQLQHSQDQITLLTTLCKLGLQTLFISILHLIANYNYISALYLSTPAAHTRMSLLKSIKKQFVTRNVICKHELVQIYLLKFELENQQHWNERIEARARKNISTKPEYHQSCLNVAPGVYLQTGTSTLTTYSHQSHLSPNSTNIMISKFLTAY